MDSLHDLERVRVQLEQQMADVDRALSHWRKWEIDYEILREEIVTERPRTPELLASLAGKFQGKLLKAQEIQKLLKSPAGQSRTTKEVVDLLKHRLEYVRKNVDSLSKQQISIAEQLGIGDEVLPLETTGEDGLPLTEIIEELDDAGNVLSSSTSTPNEDLVRKLQEKREPGSGTARSDQLNGIPASLEDTRVADAAQAAAKARAEELAASLLEQEDNDEGDEQESAQVALAQLLDRIAEVDGSGDSAIGPTLTRRTDTVAEDAAAAAAARASGLHSQPVVPEEESLEDAALRREMLDYSLNEVGAVVAEMDFDAASDDEMPEHDDVDMSDEDSEEEDQWGRTIQPKIPEGYRKEMMELEKQLDARRIQNIGPAPGRISPDSEKENADTISAIPLKRPSVDLPAKGALKKTPSSESKARGVRFAEEVDISEDAGAKSRVRSRKPVEQQTGGSPLSAEILERIADPTAPASFNASTPRRQSRFRTDSTLKHDDPQTQAVVSTASSVATPPANYPVAPASAEKFAATLLDATDSRPQNHAQTPEGPPGVTHDKVIERNPTTLTRAPDNEEALTLSQRQKTHANREGGDDDDGDDEHEQARPRVSRFKASRLARQK